MENLKEFDIILADGKETISVQSQKLILEQRELYNKDCISMANDLIHIEGGSRIHNSFFMKRYKEFMKKYEIYTSKGIESDMCHHCNNATVIKFGKNRKYHEKMCYSCFEKEYKHSLSLDTRIDLAYKGYYGYLKGDKTKINLCDFINLNTIYIHATGINKLLFTKREANDIFNEYQHYNKFMELVNYFDKPLEPKKLECPRMLDCAFRVGHRCMYIEFSEHGTEDAMTCEHPSIENENDK